MLTGLGEPRPCIQLFSCCAWLKKSLPVGNPPPVVKLPPVSSESPGLACCSIACWALFRSSRLCAGDNTPLLPLPGEDAFFAASSAAAMNSAAARFSALDSFTTLAGLGHCLLFPPPLGLRLGCVCAVAVILDVGDSSSDVSESSPVRTLTFTGDGEVPRPNHERSTLMSRRLSALCKN